VSKRTLSFRSQFTCLPITILIGGLITAVPAVRADVEFLRGDVNADGIVSTSDGVMLNRFQFEGRTSPTARTHKMSMTTAGYTSWI